MIPVRVYLRNFLCHREQEFVFDGHPVWLLHGPNGVGKSAVFDVMVYALFGEHCRREGIRNSVGDLVRYGESSMRVEFDFECHDRRYRVWRTRTRSGQPRQGVGEFVEGNPDPRPIRDVNSVNELGQWVHATLGLSYDAFVSAALLRQGAAERLIDADREARRDLFRGIIDLEPYIRLHNAVTTSRTEVNGVVRSLRESIQRMAEVTEAQIAAATAGLDNATAVRERTRAEETTARERLGQARLWDRLNEMCRAIQQQLNDARDRAERAQELERSFVRLGELREIVPAIARLARLQDEVNTTQATFETVTEQHRNATQRQAELVADTERVRQQIADHRGRMSELDRQFHTTKVECQRLRVEINQAEQAADLHHRLDEARARHFDPDLDMQLALAQAAVAESQASRDATPHLEAIHRNRAVYRQATSDARISADSETASTAELVRLEEAVADARHVADAARERGQAVGQAVAVAESRLTHARNRITRFSTVAGAAVCSECGQPIDATHVARELDRLEQAVREADAEALRCRGELRTAIDATEAAQQFARQRENERCVAEKARDTAARNRRDAVARANSARLAFDNARLELAPDLADRVGEVDSPGFPTDGEVNQARVTGQQLQTRIRTRNEVQAYCQERDNTANTIQMLTQAVAAIGAPADMTAARAELTRCEQCLGELDNDRATEQRRLLTAERADGDLAEHLRQAAAKVNQLAAALGGAQARATDARLTFATAVAALPEGATTWNASALADELQTLEAAHVERELEALAGDRVLRAEWDRNLADTERQIEEQVPPDARRPIAEVNAQVEMAERALKEAERLHRLAHEELGRLTNQRNQRERTQQQLIGAERRHALHDRLAHLLGPEGIQLELVRHAEWRIIELANVTLNDVSRGELRFEPPDPAATQALDLSIRHRSCPEPIPVGNLSGGERCRVAISLALAVCRFACGEVHPLQSIIIDEAFANLDRDGRMAMIDVIHNGAVEGSILRRIIVVSHHEDVAGAFPVSYRLANANGVTTVTRFG
jgi:DNA repair protein SbcC/Rad50